MDSGGLDASAFRAPGPGGALGRLHRRRRRRPGARRRMRGPGAAAGAALGFGSGALAGVAPGRLLDGGLAGSGPGPRRRQKPPRRRRLDAGPPCLAGRPARPSRADRGRSAGGPHLLRLCRHERRGEPVRPSAPRPGPGRDVSSNRSPPTGGDRRPGALARRLACPTGGGSTPGERPAVRRLRTGGARGLGKRGRLAHRGCDRGAAGRGEARGGQAGPAAGGGLRGNRSRVQQPAVAGDGPRRGHPGRIRPGRRPRPGGDGHRDRRARSPGCPASDDLRRQRPAGCATGRPEGAGDVLAGGATGG